MPGLTLPSSGGKNNLHYSMIAGGWSAGVPVVSLFIACLEHSPSSMAFLSLLGTILTMPGILTTMAAGGHLGQD